MGTSPHEVTQSPFAGGVQPIGIIDFTPGDPMYSTDLHSYILNPFDPAGTNPGNRYRWIQVQALIVCNPNYIMFKEGGESAP